MAERFDGRLDGDLSVSLAMPVIRRSLALGTSRSTAASTT
jgi:hypothetical protein